MTPQNPPPIDPDRMPAPERGMEPAPDYHPRHPGVGKLKDQVALVTGGDSGIGRAVAVLFAREGADVAIAYYDEDRDAEDTAAAIRDEGREALLIAGDLGEREHAFEAVRATVERFGKLDILVNNAAANPYFGHILDTPVSAFDKTVDVNLRGYFYMSVEGAKLMKENGGGAIVNTASIAGQIAFPGVPGYVASKHGVVGLTRTVATEFGARGIRCNAIAPGFVETPMTEMVLGDPRGQEMVGATVPMQRSGTAIEIAEQALWLCSARASYVNGALHAVDGGFLAR